ncbi:hypothetical protein LIER_40477 [Lithospermum erythrorhizon]|uniref:Uncharacterized protein n=1 Tax=Lithospermum erythrorhizon TaxID=34254 RepID=A0AAV3QVF6_LITER
MEIRKYLTSQVTSAAALAMDMYSASTKLLEIVILAPPRNARIFYGNNIASNRTPRIRTSCSIRIGIILENELIIAFQ